MIDFPITNLMDEAACLRWLEQYLHPTGWRRPRCGSTNRRLFRAAQAFPGYRCRDCDRYHTILTDTTFEKTRQRPSTLVLLLRGVCQGETTARLARELALSRQHTHTLRQRLQDNANETAPLDQVTGTAFEADEVYQNAGKKSDPHRDPDDPPRRRGNAKPGHGTYATDRPPIIQIISRDTGELRLWVCDTATKETCQAILATHLPPGSTLYRDEWASYRGWPDHLTVCHSRREWARDADHDGRREVHCNTCEGSGAAIRTFLRRFRGVHKGYLACYLATYKAVYNAKTITPDVVRRLCFGKRMHGKLT